MRATALVAVALLATLAASPPGAALVKCADERGHIVYQDSTCPPGRQLRDLEADPATLSVVPGMPIRPDTPTAKPARSAHRARYALQHTAASPEIPRRAGSSITA